MDFSNLFIKICNIDIYKMYETFGKLTIPPNINSSNNLPMNINMNIRTNITM